MKQNNEKQKPNIITIAPYPYVYTTYVKQRWLGKRYIDILILEFRDFNKNYFINALSVGQIQILRKNKFIHSQDLEVVDSDVIFHFVHRHESPCFHYPYVIKTNIEYKVQRQQIEKIDGQINENDLDVSKPEKQSDADLNMNQQYKKQKNIQNAQIIYKQYIDEPQSAIIGFILKNDNSASGNDEYGNTTNSQQNKIHWVLGQKNQSRIYLAYKPAGIPVHSTSHYNEHSLIHILGGAFSPVNRLDKLVSGYLLGGFTEQKFIQQHLVDSLHSGKIMKLYVARTTKIVQKSRFILIYAPIRQRFAGKRGEINVQNDLSENPTDPDTVLHVVDPILTSKVYQQDALQMISQMQMSYLTDMDSEMMLLKEKIIIEVTNMRKDDIKTILTLLDTKNVKKEQILPGTVSAITLVKTIENSNLVLLYPVTGRTHQLRLHLQYIGSPIIDDPLYGGYRDAIEALYIDLQSDKRKEKYCSQESNSQKEQQSLTYKYSFTDPEITKLAQDAFTRIKAYRSKANNIHQIIESLDISQCDKFICVQCEQMFLADLYKDTNCTLQSQQEQIQQEEYKYTFVTKENIVKSRNPYRYLQTRISLANVYYRFFQQQNNENEKNSVKLTLQEDKLLNVDIEFQGQLPKWLTMAEQEMVQENIKLFKQII